MHTDETQRQIVVSYLKVAIVLNVIEVKIQRIVFSHILEIFSE